MNLVIGVGSGEAQPLGQGAGHQETRDSSRNSTIENIGTKVKGTSSR